MTTVLLSENVSMYNAYNIQFRIGPIHCRLTLRRKDEELVSLELHINAVDITTNIPVSMAICDTKSNTKMAYTYKTIMLHHRCLIIKQRGVKQDIQP